MNRKSVVFVAFQERENLGIGYMHAILSGAGFEVHIIDVRKGKSEILQEIQDKDPILLGFSVIFENHIYNFQELIEYLRSQGLQCHFTAGGHFASLRPADLFEIAPSLDSMVRFEGEHTILDLADHLQQNKDWKSIRGISYRDDGKLVNNELRPLEPDLDAFALSRKVDVRERAFSVVNRGRGP